VLVLATENETKNITKRIASLKKVNRRKRRLKEKERKDRKGKEKKKGSVIEKSSVLT